MVKIWTHPLATNREEEFNTLFIFYQLNIYKNAFHLSLSFNHRKTTNRTDTQSNIVPIPGRDKTYQHCNNQGVPPKMQVHFNKCLPPRMQGPFLVC